MPYLIVVSTIHQQDRYHQGVISIGSGSSQHRHLFLLQRDGRAVLEFNGTTFMAWPHSVGSEPIHAMSVMNADVAFQHCTCTPPSARCKEGLAFFCSVFVYMQRCFFRNSPIYKFRQWRLAWTRDDDDPWRSQIARHCGFVLKQIDFQHLLEIVRPTAEALLIESYFLTLPLHCTLNQRDGGIDYIDSSHKQPIKSASGKNWKGRS